MAATKPRMEMNRRGRIFRPEALAAGVTLLELLVVLALLGLITALALPNLQRLQESLARTTERDRILEQFAGLGREAMLRGRTYLILGDGPEWAEGQACEAHRESVLDADLGDGAVLGDGTAGAAHRESGLDINPDGLSCGPGLADGYALYELDLPEGWEARLNRPLVVRANGVCLGAQLRLLHRGKTAAQVPLVPPYCSIHASA